MTNRGVKEQLGLYVYQELIFLTAVFPGAFVSVHGADYPTNRCYGGNLNFDFRFNDQFNDRVKTSYMIRYCKARRGNTLEQASGEYTFYNYDVKAQCTCVLIRLHLEELHRTLGIALHSCTPSPAYKNEEFAEKYLSNLYNYLQQWEIAHLAPPPVVSLKPKVPGMPP